MTYVLEFRMNENAKDIITDEGTCSYNISILFNNQYLSLLMSLHDLLSRMEFFEELHRSWGVYT